jgi:hypothetical protein
VVAVGRHAPAAGITGVFRSRLEIATTASRAVRIALYWRSKFEFATYRLACVSSSASPTGKYRRSRGGSIPSLAEKQAVVQSASVAATESTAARPFRSVIGVAEPTPTLGRWSKRKQPSRPRFPAPAGQPRSRMITPRSAGFSSSSRRGFGAG